MNISIEKLSKKYGSNVVLKNINLNLLSGTWLSIVGVSGSGKSTLLSIIAGLLSYDSGSITMANNTTSRMRREVVSFMMQDFPLYPSINVETNLKLAQKRKDAESQINADLIVDAFNLSSCMNRLPSQLSRGEQQRSALARTLLLSRPVVLLDEPFSNIDVGLRKSIRRFVRTEQKLRGLTVILVSHDQEDAVSTSDLVSVLDKGKLIQIGTAEDLYWNPCSKFVAENFGDIDMVVIPELLRNTGKLWGKIPKSVVKKTQWIRENNFNVSYVSRPDFLETDVEGIEYLGSRYRFFIKYSTISFSVITDSKRFDEFPKKLWIQVVMAKI